MKKIITTILLLCLVVNVSFAFDPYADEEIETKSNKKLYFGIVLTLLGGFLAYDGFSQEEVDISKPRVDYTTVLHSEWSQVVTTSDPKYEIKSGTSDYSYNIEGQSYNVEQNVLYNNGNVDLTGLTIEVRYKYANGNVIENTGPVTSDGYHIASNSSADFSLQKGDSVKWDDIWSYTTTVTSPPNETQRQTDPDNLSGLNLGTNALTLIDVRVIMNKNQNYKPIYEKRNKSDIEGVAGIMIGITGIYFIVDHFLDMHKFNQYAKRHSLNLKVATAPNEYKLLFQKRI